MTQSNLDAVRPLVQAADIDQSKRIGIALEAALLAEDDLSTDTATFAVASIVGWFASTLTDAQQDLFERLIKMQFEAAAEIRKEEQAQ